MHEVERRRRPHPYPAVDHGESGPAHVVGAPEKRHIAVGVYLERHVGGTVAFDYGENSGIVSERPTGAAVVHHDAGVVDPAAVDAQSGHAVRIGVDAHLAGAVRGEMHGVAGPDRQGGTVDGQLAAHEIAGLGHFGIVGAAGAGDAGQARAVAHEFNGVHGVVGHPENISGTAGNRQRVSRHGRDAHGTGEITGGVGIAGIQRVRPAALRAAGHGGDPDAVSFAQGAGVLHGIHHESYGLGRAAVVAVDGTHAHHPAVHGHRNFRFEIAAGHYVVGVAAVRPGIAHHGHAHILRAGIAVGQESRSVESGFGGHVNRPIGDGKIAEHEDVRGGVHPLSGGDRQGGGIGG